MNLIDHKRQRMIAVAWFVVMNGPESSATYSARSLHGLEPCSVLPPQVPVLEARVRSLSHITPIDSSVCCHDPDAPVPRAIICSGALPDMPPVCPGRASKKRDPRSVRVPPSFLLFTAYTISRKKVSKSIIFSRTALLQPAPVRACALCRFHCTQVPRLSLPTSWVCPLCSAYTAVSGNLTSL